jgi:hypothetical protein
MTVVEALSQARTVLADPTHWTRYALARDATGEMVDPGDPTATCWCMLGVLASLQGPSAAVGFLKEATVVPVPRFNDTMTHQGVLDAFDRAISSASVHFSTS